MNGRAQPAPIPEAWIERLFHKMLLEYGKKFTDQWGMIDTKDMINHWAHELAGYSGSEFRAGIDGLSKRAWPPTLPEFKLMCRAPIDAMRAYYEAVAGVQARFTGEPGTWSHPAIYWAAMPMAAELREQTYSQVKARWEATLAEQLSRGAWEDIPAPMLQIAAPGKAVTSNAQGQQAIKALVGTVFDKPVGYDHKAWARRILERVQAGDKFPPVSIQFAREALGIES